MTTPSTQSSAQSSFEKIKEDISVFQRKMQRIKNQFEKSLKQTNIIIGLTGEGKSTLLNYLVDNPLIGQQPNKLKPFILNAPNIIGQIEIGIKASSTTTVPNFLLDEKRNLAYWDCPGFCDNKGSEQEIINGFYIWQILRNCQEMKIILVVSEDSLQNKVTNFISALSSLQSTFVNLESITSAIALIITKTKFIKSAQDCKQMIATIIDELGNQKTFTEIQKKLLNHFTSEKGNVIFFPAPEIKDKQIGKQQAEEIRKIIQKSNFVPRQLTRIPVSEKSHLALQNIGKNMNIEIEKVCANSNNFLEQKCSDVIKQSASYEEVIKKLKEIEKLVKAVTDAKEGIKFHREWIQMGEKLNLMFDKDKMENATTQLLFVRSVNEEVQVNLSAWKQKFTVLKTIDSLTKQPIAIIKQNGTTLQIKCDLIGIQKIEKFIEEKCRIKPACVYILCRNTLFIDKDLRCPGFSFCILSNYWKIIGNRKIDLKGADGTSYISTVAKIIDDPSLDGEDGLSGRPGQTGGSFFGKIISYQGNFGPGTLTIDVRGGNGGKGQDGGNGRNGKNGNDANQNEVLQRNQNFLVNQVPYNYEDKQGLEAFNHAWKQFLTVNSQMLKTYQEDGQEGQKGGNGGKGGAGGLPGNSGIVQLQKLMVNIISGKGTPGQQGNPGKQGLGGKNGRSYEGEYIEETAFTAFRQEGKTILSDQVLQPTLDEKRDCIHRIFLPLLAGKLGKQAIFQVGEQAILKVAQVVATQGTKQIVKSSAALTAGATLGTGLAVQAGLSVASSYLSNGWKSKGFIENGSAPNGIVPNQLNFEGQQNPTPTLIISDEKIQQLENESIMNQNPDKLCQFNLTTKLMLIKRVSKKSMFQF